MSDENILVAGLGNLFRGDDAFGSEVARHMLGRDVPPGVRVVDFGTRGYDFAFALADGYDCVVILDAIDRGAEPGTLLVIEPEVEDLGSLHHEELSSQSHDVHPLAAVRFAKTFCEKLPRLILVGCQPLDVGDEDQGRMGLSPPVAAAIEPALQRVMSLLADVGSASKQSVAR